MENKLSCKQFMRRAVQKTGWGRRLGHASNLWLTKLGPTARASLSRKDTAAGLVRSACLGSYHNAR